MSKCQNLMHLLGDKYVYYNNNTADNVKEKYSYEDCRLFTLFYEIGVNRFIWEGLPPSIESRHIERFLMEHGKVMFTIDDTLGLICLPCVGEGDLNIYGEYCQYNLLRHDGEPMNYSVKPYIRGEVSPINEESNLEKETQYGWLLKPYIYDQPFVEHVCFYSAVVEEFELSYLMNLQQQRFTNIIPTSDKMKLTTKTLIGKVYDYEPFVLADKSFTDEYLKSFKTLDMGVKYLIGQLWEDKQKVISEFLTLCGINNNPMYKKERQIQSEVNANNELIDLMIEKELTSRQEVAKYLSKATGHQITCRRQKDLLLKYQKMLLQEGGNQDGKLHTENNGNNAKSKE